MSSIIEAAEQKKITDALFTEGSEKIAELIRECDAARQEAADLRAALREAQEIRYCDECGALVN